MTRTKLMTLIFVAGTGFVLSGIWTRWLLEDRLLQTGAVLLTVWLVDRLVGPPGTI